MENILQAKERPPPNIDNRILEAVKRNRQYLGLSDWLERYDLAREKSSAQCGDKLTY